MNEPRWHEFDAPDPEGVGVHTISYYEWGKPGKDPVICVHGLTRTGRDFDFLARELAKDFRVICPDVAGRGKSAWLKSGKWYGYPLYVADMMALLKHLELMRVRWVGTSMGGLTGMLVAASMPNLISRMVLNDIGPFMPKEALARIGTYVGQNMEFPNMEAAEKYLRQILAPFGITKEEHWRHMAEHTFVTREDSSCRFAYDPRIAFAFWNKRGRMRRMTDIDMWHKWEAIQCRMLALRGETSDLLREDTAARMKESGKVDDVITIKGAGHAPSLMEEDQITLIRDWLAS